MSQITTKSPIPATTDDATSLKNPRPRDKVTRSASVGKRLSPSTSNNAFGSASTNPGKGGSQNRSVSNPRPHLTKPERRREDLSEAKGTAGAKQSVSQSHASPRRERVRLAGVLHPFTIQPMTPTARLSQPQPTKERAAKSVPDSALVQGKSSESPGPKYVILPGNNSDLVREALQRRTWWSETTEDDTGFNFKWKETGQSIGHDKYNTNPQLRQIINHLDNHSELCTKTGLFRWQCLKVYKFIS